MDNLNKKHRSWNMSRIKSKNTRPERIVRSVLFRMGYRFRLTRKDLPCKPDVILPKYKTVIFVHGCFWHRHQNCKYAYEPKSNIQRWQKKFDENVKRDKRNTAELEKLGWNVVIVWECQTKKISKLTSFLSYSISGYLMQNLRENCEEYK